MTAGFTFLNAHFLERANVFLPYKSNLSQASKQARSFERHIFSVPPSLKASRTVGSKRNTFQALYSKHYFLSLLGFEQKWWTHIIFLPFPRDHENPLRATVARPSEHRSKSVFGERKSFTFTLPAAGFVCRTVITFWGSIPTLSGWLGWMALLVWD